ncbi:alpha-L-fucosidase [Sphingomonas piscis]|uniref:alpha-L-fucosidase n=1 Tax=Sphingomonas piscis TaxID=2714943 RepID=A0A6G7YNA8_9SPHN|nr:alpha-L-fucosidase [Sphingomonas piscis]QIK78206.1 alpha-L-fucosidase [Sphingomonas piscis]
MRINRRQALIGGLAAGAGSAAAVGQNTELSWESLASTYQAPDWFRDAKFGIWAHWGPQCQPERGDWYGRLMYIQGRQSWQQGETAYEHHLGTYGHPSKTGFLDIIGQWKAENWDPAYLLKRYQRTGARYFMAMANHHDNLDLFDSAHHDWNSVRVGPKRDIIGTWEKLVRQTSLKFAVSNHSSHAWHWWQTAYGYDAEGPMRGRRYDAYWRRKHHGRGTFWEGLDPQDLYTGPTYVPPAGITSAEAMTKWHDARDGQWVEDVPPGRQAFADKWLLRQMDLVEKYRPDMVYFDDHQIPFGRVGLQAVQHFYRKSMEWRGDMGVVTAKRLTEIQTRGIVQDVERGFVAGIMPQPWQTDTCIGNWHYDRPLYERGGYKSAKDVVQRLADVVSKNGNLMLNIPVRGDGSIDEKEEAILDQIAAWNARNGEAIFGTRPWHTFGEGPTKPPLGHMAEGEAKPFTAEDVRFTVKGDVLYAIFLDWSQSMSALASLGKAALGGREIERVDLLGGPQLRFAQEADALRLQLPPTDKGGFVPAIRLRGRGLV